ncbi:hypothetical protein [Clostridium sp.]|uniref:hypothetical protein n=1 Tax=Clostridium sp. TaxID=1506 RepID=UPI002610168D|nr:hypothetical protein [Clostridium sp.]
MNNISENLVEIRKAEINDLETIVKFNYNLAKETEDKELDLEILCRGVSAVINDPAKGKYYVYVIDNKVVGHIKNNLCANF